MSKGSTSKGSTRVGYILAYVLVGCAGALFVAGTIKLIQIMLF